jgi:peptidoglycan/xylan/chitin deacetylase (PgdA/CDA1 family)
LDDPRIAQRREERRAAEREQRVRWRRRALAVGAGVGVVAAVGVAVAVSVGGDGSGSSQTPADAQAGGSIPGLESTGTTAAAPTVANFHGPVPILMYHAIQPAPPDAAMPELFVPESEFEDEMRWLAHHGYHAVTLDQVFAAWNEGKPIASKPVVVSFDDGLQSQYVGARPMLERLGWPGVLDLAISHLDTAGDMTAAEVKELIVEGWELDSHTFSHLDVTTLDRNQLDHEVGDSRTYLQHRFGVPVDFFCYPAGDYDDTAIAAVKAAGYLGATTTEEGLATPEEDPGLLSRIRVEPGDGAEGLAERITAG